MRGPPKKTGPVEKEWQVGRDNNSRSRRPRTAAPGLARGRMVPSCWRGPGAYALLSRADGQLTRTGQHYYFHLGLRPPSKNFDFNQPLIRKGPFDTFCCATGRRSLCAPCRADQAGQAPGPRAGDHPGQAAQHPASYGGAGAAFFHFVPAKSSEAKPSLRQQVEASLDPGGPILQLSDKTHFLDPEGYWHPEHALQELQSLRQRIRALRSVSFQLPCKKDAFKDKPLCVPRQPSCCS